MRNQSIKEPYLVNNLDPVEIRGEQLVVRPGDDGPALIMLRQLKLERKLFVPGREPHLEPTLEHCPATRHRRNNSN